MKRQDRYENKALIFYPRVINKYYNEEVDLQIQLQLIEGGISYEESEKLDCKSYGV